MSRKNFTEDAQQPSGNQVLTEPFDKKESFLPKLRRNQSIEVITYTNKPSSRYRGFRNLSQDERVLLESKIEKLNTCNDSITSFIEEATDIRTKGAKRVKGIKDLVIINRKAAKAETEKEDIRSERYQGKEENDLETDRAREFQPNVLDDHKSILEEIKSFEKILKRKDEKIKNLEHQRKDLEGQMKKIEIDFNHKMAWKGEEVRMLVIEKRAYQDKQHELLKTVEKYENEKQALLKDSGSLLKVTQECEKLKTSLKQSNEEEKKWKEKYGVLEKKALELSDKIRELKKLEEDFKKGKEQQDSSKKEVSALKAKLKEKENELENVKKVVQELENAKGKIKDMEKDLAQKENLVINKDKEIAETQNTISALKEERDKLEAFLKEKKEKLKSRKNQAQAQEISLKEKDEKMDELETALEEQRRKFEQLENILKEKDLLIAKKDKLIAEMELLADEKLQEIVEARDRIEELEDFIKEDNKTAEINNLLRQENKILKETLGKQNDDIDLLKQQAAFRSSFVQRRSLAINDENLYIHVKEASELNTGSIEKLVDYLEKVTRNDIEKAWMIYLWIALNIAYDVKDKFNAKNPGLSKNLASLVLKKRKANCLGYCELFSHIGRKIGLEVELVPGFAKGPGYVQFLGKFEEADHVWVAVKIEGTWYLCDPMWGAGFITETGKFKFHLNNFYFLTMPWQFITNHLPLDQAWQLLENPISIEEYQRSIEFQDAYFKYELELVREKFKVIETEESTITLHVKSPENVFIMCTIEFGGKEKDGLNFIQSEEEEDKRINTIDIIFPAQGTYKLKIFAKKGKKKHPYVSVFELTLGSKGSIQAKTVNFPIVFSPFTERRCYLYEPRKRAVTIGSLQSFKIYAPGASILAIVVGSSRKYLAKIDQMEDTYEGQVKIDADSLVIYAKFGLNTNFESILQYPVHQLEA